MKTIILMAVFASLNYNVFAQKKYSPPKNEKIKTEAAKPVKYWCPVAYHTYSSDKPGVCPLHNVELVKEGDFYCEPEFTASTTPGRIGKLPEERAFPVNTQRSSQPGVCTNGKAMKKMRAKTPLNTPEKNKPERIKKDIL